MAWYDITATPLNETAEKYSIFANDLNTLGERLRSIQVELSGTEQLTEQKMRIAANLRILSERAENTGRKLNEIVEVYAKAERLAFGGGVGVGIAAQKLREDTIRPNEVHSQIFRRSDSVLMFGDLVTPDWLQAAVLKYEQARGS